MNYKNIVEHFKRSVTDIARKCETTEDIVKFVISDVLATEDEYVVIQWPEIQEFMDEEGFDVNSSLANDEWSLEKYGSSAYFVSKSWLDAILKKRYEEQEADNYLSTIEAHEIH